MNAHAKFNQFATVNLLEVFELRCWARAHLVAACVMTVAEAVDALQVAAEEYGLIESLGQDGVQEILAENFGAAHV